MNDANMKLWASANDGYLDGIKEAIAEGANIDLPDPSFYGFTALHYAARKNSLECIKFLIDAGADVTLVNQKDETAAAWSINSHKNREAIKLFEDAAEMHKRRHPFSTMGDNIAVLYKGQHAEYGTLSKIFDFKAKTVTQVIDKTPGPAQSFDEFRNNATEILEAYEWLSEQGQQITPPFQKQTRHFQKR